MSGIEVWASWLTVIGGILALLLYIYPKIKKWAIRRGVMYWHWKLLLSYEPNLERFIVGSNSVQKKAWYLSQRLSFKLIKYVVPSSDYVMIAPYSQAVEKELQDSSRGILYDPNLDSDPLIRDLTTYVDAIETDVFDQNFIKRHKGIVCATDGCQVKYGQRRQDHDFICEDGLNLSGGWFCPTPNTDDSADSCFPKASGAHYCGMCLKEMGEISPLPIEVSFTRRF